MANGVTKLENLINPEVMADMINAKLTAAIKTLPYATVDDTLEGNEGDSIDYPTFKYIGDAVDVAEGAEIEIRKLEATSTKFKVKMAGVGVAVANAMPTLKAVTPYRAINYIDDGVAIYLEQLFSLPPQA